MNTLDRIVNQTRDKVKLEQAHVSLAELKNAQHYKRIPFSLTQAIKSKRAKGLNSIIAEFKRQSPSKGVIATNPDIFSLTQIYQEAGATAISVLTSESFAGNILDIETIRNQIQIPILRKEFIVDEFQIHQAKGIGSDVILLIAAALSFEECESYIDLAHELGLEVLIEIHDESELSYLDLNADVIGINNRNLKTFEVSLQQSMSLIGKIKSLKASKQMDPKTPIISESGIESKQDIDNLNLAGFDGYLIGETLMKSLELKQTLESWVRSNLAH